jgi:hypothetical protein
VRRRGEADPGGGQSEDQAEGADQPERRLQRQQRRHDREGRDRGGGPRSNGGTSTTWFVQVLRIRDVYPAMLRIRIYKIRMFLGLLDPDPDPVVRGTVRIRILLSKNSKKNLNSYCFVTSL